MEQFITPDIQEPSIDKEMFALVIEKLKDQDALPPSATGGMIDEDLAVGSNEELTEEQLKMILDALMSQQAADPSIP
jgi:hypothetical protein